MDEKKKLVVVGALFVVVIAVGAFQMIGSSATPPRAPVAANKEDAKKDSAVQPAKNPLYAMDLEARDPFKAEAMNPIAPLDPVKVPDPVQHPKTDQMRQVRRAAVQSELPPFPIDRSGALPPAQGGISVSPIEKPGFAYSVSGLILGSKPAVVFVDAQGSQRLVPLGKSLDGDSRVIGVEKGRVIVSFKGQIIRMSPGGNGSAK